MMDSQRRAALARSVESSGAVFCRSCQTLGLSSSMSARPSLVCTQFGPVPQQLHQRGQVARCRQRRAFLPAESAYCGARIQSGSQGRSAPTCCAVQSVHTITWPAGVGTFVHQPFKFTDLSRPPKAAKTTPALCKFPRLSSPRFESSVLRGLVPLQDTPPWLFVGTNPLLEHTAILPRLITRRNACNWQLRPQ